MFIIYIIILILFISLFFLSKYININIKNHNEIKMFIEKNIFLVSFIIFFLFLFFFNLIRLKKQKNKMKEIQKNKQEELELLIQEQEKNYIKTQKEQLIKQQQQQQQLGLYPQSFNIYTWKNELENWKNGILPFDNIFYDDDKALICSPIYNLDLNSKFDFNIVNTNTNKNFNNGDNDFSKYGKILNNNPNDFWNLDNTSILIIPPYEYDNQRNKINFANIYQFQKNASDKIKKQFWSHVANIIEQICRTKSYKNTQLNKDLYINTHGGTVPYFHLRIDLDNYKYHSRLNLRKQNLK